MGAVAGAALGAVLGGTLIGVIIPAMERTRQAVIDARHVRQLDTTLSLEVLNARQSPLGSFDPTVIASRALESDSARILGAREDAPKGDRTGEAAAIDAARVAAAAAIQRKLAAIEDCKTSLAVLRSATAQLLVLAADLARVHPTSQAEVEVHDDATVVLLALARLMASRDSLEAQQAGQAHPVEDARAALHAALIGRDELRAVVARVLEQAQLAQRETGQVGDRIEQALGVRVDTRIDELIAALVRRYERLESRRRLVELGICIATLASAIMAIRVLLSQRQTRVMLEQRVAERTQDLADANQHLTLASRAKSEFLANMSHEIRTPLAAILGFADVLDDELLDAGERRKITGILRRNGEHLLAILSNILDIAKIEAGKLALEEISCSPRQIAEEVCSLLRNQAESKGIRLAFRVEAAVIPRRIESDPTRIRQILVNLVGNAIKFTAKGGVTLALGLDLTPDGPRLMFEVRDSGIGLSEQDQKRIFAEFEQADASTTRRFGGTGLGLAICRRLARALSGEITVKSVPNQGATFRLLLPIKESAQTEDNLYETAVVAPRGIPPRRGLRVLVADDSSDIQMLVTRFLTDISAHVVVASNGQQAVDLVLAAEREAHPFDLVLMDLHMPELDGAEAVRELRAAGIDRPIIALTASAYLEDRDRCEQAGYNEFLTKPIDRGHLMQRIATLCGGRSPTEVPIPPRQAAEVSRPPAEIQNATAQPAMAFDAKRLLALVGGDQGARNAVMALFRKDAPPLMRTIQVAVSAGDVAAVHAGAHKLKGMLLNVAARAAQIAGDLESAARAGERDQLPGLAVHLHLEVERLCESLASYNRSAA